MEGSGGLEIKEEIEGKEEMGRERRNGKGEKEWERKEEMGRERRNRERRNRKGEK